MLCRCKHIAYIFVASQVVCFMFVALSLPENSTDSCGNLIVIDNNSESLDDPDIWKSRMREVQGAIIIASLFQVNKFSVTRSLLKPSYCSIIQLCIYLQVADTQNCRDVIRGIDDVTEKRVFLLTGGYRCYWSHWYHATLHRTARHRANYCSYGDRPIWSCLELLRRKLVDCPHVRLIHENTNSVFSCCGGSFVMNSCIVVRV